MSASENTATKITAGQLFEAMSGRTLLVLAVEGWRVTYRVEGGMDDGAVETTSYVDFSRAIRREIRP